MRRSIWFRAALAAAFLVCLLSAAAPASEGTLIKLTDRLGTTQLVKASGLPQLTYRASYKRSSGTIVGPYSYTGPSIASILALMGGVGKGDAVQLISDDGYRMTLTYEQLMGEVTVYDEKGEALEAFAKPVMMLALASDNPAFSSGNPRAIYAGPETPLTDGHTWVKSVVEIRVIPMVKEWVLELKGAVQAKMDRSTFESLATCPASPHPGSEFAEGQSTYAGTPLWTLVSVVDNVEEENSHYTFDRKRAAEGYIVRVTSRDGSYVDIRSQDMADEPGIFVAFTKGGVLLTEEEGPLMLTGPKAPAPLRNIASIELIGLVK